MTSRSGLRRAAAVNGEAAPEFDTTPPAAPGGRAAGIPAVPAPPGGLPSAAPSPASIGDGAALKRQQTSLGKPLTAAQRKALRMQEAYLQNAVIDLCKQLGILWYHAYQPMRDPAGWADLSMSGWHGTIFRELKAEGEKPTPKQAEWGQRMLAGGENWALWFPADLQSGRIACELAAIR